MTSPSQGGDQGFNSPQAHFVLIKLLGSLNLKMPTRREEIIRILENEERTAKELANQYETILADILKDLDHIKYSIKPRQLKMKPPYCKKCGFVFVERSRVKSPSRCPKCKSEWIQAPLFRIV